MHDTDFFHEHAELTEAERADIARYIWSQESVDLTTVGIDIGSSTSHLLFAKVLLQRQTQGLSSRFVVTSREVVWRSPILLTPFLPDGSIDAHRLGHFIHDAYHDAGLERRDVDSGAVILTGEAIKKRNARAIDELFAADAGKFVCATAGHKLECLLAAHGSGAVALSKARRICLLHVDIGGGTTKLALIDRGQVLGVAAFAVGGRLLAADAEGRWTRVDDTARAVLDELGMADDPATLADAALRERVAGRLAAMAADYILAAPPDLLAASLLLTEPLARPLEPQALSFSGGVSEYIFSHEAREFGDIARPLARALTAQLSRRSALPLIDPGQRIRATVIGASQFSVQVSGKTIYLPDGGALPVHNVPVVQVGLDLSGPVERGGMAEAVRAGMAQLDLAADSMLAVAFAWTGDPDYPRLRAAAEGIADAVDAVAGPPLLLMIDGDVGRSFGRLLGEELGLQRPVIAIDGVQLQALDFVDIGEMIEPPGVVPVVIKSLLFSAPEAR